MTQQDLATRMGRTGSWMSQVERGVQPVERIDVLQQLADVLNVSVGQLHPDAPPTPRPPASLEPVLSNDLDEARLLISGHPALGTLLGAPPPADGRSLAELGAAVDEVWELTHAARMSEVSALVTDLLPVLERTARTVPAEDRQEVYLLLSRAYQALAAAFVRQDEADAAWVAADRAINTAELSGSPLHVCASVYRLVQAFVRIRRLEQAEHAATTAIAALQQRDDLEVEAQSVLGSLHLALALVHARAGQRTEARVQISEARALAEQVGEGRNDFNLEFGPLNVEIQAVSTAVDLGDAGEALETGLAISPDALSPERQGRLYMDLGRAHAQRRHPGEALAMLLRAENLIPETVRTHMAAREAIRELVLVAGANATPELLALAERASALE